MEIDVKHIAKLARLRLEDGEILKFQKDMEAVVNMIHNLPDIENTESLLDTENIMKLRKDTVSECGLTRKELLQNAAVVQAGCPVVPRIME